MLAHYNASVRYLMNEQALLGNHDGFAASQHAQLNSLVSVCRATPLCLDDVSALQERLSEETPAFTADHRMQLGRVISQLLANGASTPNLSRRDQCPTQTNKYSYDYHTDGLWTLLFSADSSHAACQHAMAAEGIQYGFRNPKELDFVRMNSTIQAAKGVTYAPEVQYQQLQDFKDIWENKRRCNPGEQTMQSFVANPLSFCAMYANRFLPDAPPVPSRVPANTIMEIARAHPARHSHKALKTTKNLAKNRAESVEEKPTSVLEALTAALLRHVASPADRARRDNPLLALEDKEDSLPKTPSPPLHRPSAVSLACVSPKPEIVQSEVSAVSLACVSPKPSIVPSKMSAVALACVSPTPIIVSSEEKPTIDVVDECGELDYVEAPKYAAAPVIEMSPLGLTSPSMSLDEMRASVAQSIKNRTDAALPKEAPIAKRRKDASIAVLMNGVDVKRVRLHFKQPAPGFSVASAAPCPPPVDAVPSPSVAIGAAGDDGEKPAMSLKPTAYGGGKIYFSQSKHCFRAYRRCGDKIERTCVISDDTPEAKARAWAMALRAIDEDPRPRF